MRLQRTLVMAMVMLAGAAGSAQDVALEYRVKAVFLYNFLKFVEWPASQNSGPMTICVAGRNPFGNELTTVISGDSVNGRPLATRVIAEPEADCSVLFIPADVPAANFLRAARLSPTLTVGDADNFLRAGGMIAFTLEDGKVRFDVNTATAERSDIRISSRLLRVARTVERREVP